MSGPEPVGMASIRLRVEEVRAETLRAIDHETAARSQHEAVCAERQIRITQLLEDMGDKISDILKGQSAFQAKAHMSAWAVNWKAWVLAGAIIMLLISALAWTGGQLWATEPLRIAASHHS